MHDPLPIDQLGWLTWGHCLAAYLRVSPTGRVWAFGRTGHPWFRGSSPQREACSPWHLGIAADASFGRRTGENLPTDCVEDGLGSSAIGKTGCSVRRTKKAWLLRLHLSSQSDSVRLPPAKIPNWAFSEVYSTCLGLWERGLKCAKEEHWGGSFAMAPIRS